MPGWSTGESQACQDPRICIEQTTLAKLNNCNSIYNFMVLFCELDRDSTLLHPSELSLFICEMGVKVHVSLVS